MCQNCLVKTIHSVHSHFGWDNSFTPVERVAPGTTLEFECHDSSNGHFTKDSVVADVTSMPFDRINPVSGTAVSYTHLDVYKRQGEFFAFSSQTIQPF